MSPIEAAKVIGWFIGLIISIISVFQFVGISGIVNMFPEGRRWWMLPTQLLSLVIFAIVVLYHPFK
jgi:hypothetical protein